MSEEGESVVPGGKSKKRRWTLWTAIGGLGAVAGALSVPMAVQEFVKWTSERVERAGAVDLPTSFPDEIWKRASVEEYAWLADEWCYPSLPGFVTRFRVVDAKLQRQNQGQAPRPFTTEWVDVDVYNSSLGSMRLWHHKDGWPGNYVHYTPGKTAEWRENERYAADDGTISAGDKRLVLSCARCSVSADGFTYSCAG